MPSPWENANVRNKREVRYVVSRLEDPGDLAGARETLGYHPSLDLAKRHADRVGTAAIVDAQGGSYSTEGPYRRRGQWRVEWTNGNLYRGGSRKRPEAEPTD